MKRKKSVKNSQSLITGEVNASNRQIKDELHLECNIDEIEIPVERSKFICALCKKTFSDKNCLKKHIKKIHNVEPESLLQNETEKKIKVVPFKCRVCETEFAYKRNLKRHLIKYHSQGLEEEEGGSCFCNVEGCKFRSFFISALRTHLTEEHKVPIEMENKLFSSKAEFDQWKEEEEKTNVCLFIKEAGKHTLINGDQRLIYQCHRSGHYSGHGFGKRSFRVKGTCKLGKRCTAGIELTVKDKVDTHEVVYYKTHIWHTPDILHVNLSATERTYLANKLREGASIASILESVKADQSVEGTNFCKRIHLLKRKDLVNIENTFRLNNTERHLKKLHKKGQKIDFGKIKKNIDDYGEVVSWVVESPGNAFEYFTVKKLQPEKCTESCGVVCTSCNACLHMYSCTCHDYLLFGTMCLHIHSVSLSLNPIQKSKRQSPKTILNGGTAKRKKKEKPESHITEVIESESDHKESDIINFLTKNLELQREEELQQERMKLRQKLEYFNSLWVTKIDQMDESSIQMILKIIDSAIDSLHGSSQSNELEILNNIQPIQLGSSVIPTDHVQSNHLLPVSIQISGIQHASNAIESDNLVQKQMINMNTLSVNGGDRKYVVSPQFCSTLKKKRRAEDLGFYRPPVMEKRSMFENVTNEHSLVHDNYPTFDCNVSTWQTTTVAGGNTLVGKWWT